MVEKSKKKKEKKPIKQPEKIEIKADEKETLPSSLSIFKDIWKDDYSEFLYSGTAVSSSTTNVAIGNIFKDDKKYVEEWTEKRKEEKVCPYCNIYFPSFLSHCPKCKKKIE